MKAFAIDIRLLGRKRTGDETVFFHLTKHLLRLDRENRYLLLTDICDRVEQKALLERLGGADQTNVTVVGLPGRNRFLWNLVLVPWYLLTHRIDVYHTQYILPFWVPRRTKVVTHIHDVSFAAYPKLIDWKDRLFLGLFIPHALRRADRVVTPSQFTKDEIVKYFGLSRDKIEVVANALGDDYRTPGTEGTERLPVIRAKYGLPSRYLIYVGTLQPRKNIPYLIGVFARLRERLPDVALVLVGNRFAHHFDGRIDQAVAAHALQEAVVFPGYIEQADLPTVLRAAEVFVFPSLYEGFGIPVLEAFSQKVPVAISDIPCLKEVAAGAALSLPLDRVDAASEILYTLITQPELRKSLVESGQARLKHYSWEASARRLLALYNTLGEIRR